MPDYKYLYILCFDRCPACVCKHRISTATAPLWVGHKVTWQQSTATRPLILWSESCWTVPWQIFHLTKHSIFGRNTHGRLNASWKICSLAVNGQSFLVIDGYLLNPWLTIVNLPRTRNCIPERLHDQRSSPPTLSSYFIWVIRLLVDWSDRGRYAQEPTISFSFLSLSDRSPHKI